MARTVFNIELTDQSVDVRLITSENSPRGRFYAVFGNLAMMVLVPLFCLSCPRRNGGTSIWHDLSSVPLDSFDFMFYMSLLIVMVGIPVLYMTVTSWEYGVAANPSDQTLYCDRSTLTISTVRWLDIDNKDWETCSYALEEITKMKYGVIAATRGGTVYGLCFCARSKVHCVLPGVKPRTADKILKALKALGVDVPDNPKLITILAESASIPDDAI
jgi:hypothetical protein